MVIGYLLARYVNPGGVFVLVLPLSCGAKSQRSSSSLVSKKVVLSEGRIPMRSFAVSVYRMKLFPFESFFTMFDDSRELRQRHEFVRLYEIFFLARSRCAGVVFPARVSFLPVHPPSDEIGGGFGTGFVRRFKDDSVPKIKDRDLRFLSCSQGREKGGLRLSGHDCCGVCLAYDVDIKVRIGDESLRFVLPADQQIVFIGAPSAWRSGIKSAECMSIKQEL